MDNSDIKRLATLKREKSENEQALARSIFIYQADRLQGAIRSQAKAIANLELGLKLSGRGSA
jgi:hypothetical protein